MSEDCGCEGGEPPQPRLVGGFGAEKPADKEVQEICNQVKEQFEKRTGANLKTFTAISYSLQVVAGTNYRIKVEIGCDKYADLFVFKPLPQEKMCPQLKNIKQNVGKCEKITL